MSEPAEKPGNAVTAIAKAKPKLVIFDDRALMLDSFTEKFRKLGYDVTPVYVSDGQYDYLFEDGKIKRGMPNPIDPNDFEVQDSPSPEIRTIDIAIAEAEAKISTDVHPRYKVELAQLKAIEKFTYAVTNCEQAEKILRELQPDCVLTDFEMRKAGRHYVSDPLMGNDIMELSQQLYPNAPRVMHTSLYTFPDDGDFKSFLANDENKTAYYKALEDAAAGGYLLSSKDVTAEQTEYSSAIHKYFKLALLHGHSPGITTDQIPCR